MSEQSIEERITWLEGKSEEWAQLEQIVIGQAKQIDQLENELHMMVSERDVLREQLNFAQNQAEEALEKCAILMRAVGRESAGSGAAKMKAPKPKDYSGTRDSKEVDNFVFDMEQYFRICQLDDNMKVDTATMHLTDDAKLWWRTKHGDIEAGRIKIDTWEEFKKELKDQFYPENTDFVARRRLMDIKQTGSIRDYVREFSACMLDIKDMTEKDRMYKFIFGLKDWAQRELLRQKLDTLSSAVSAAERLMDFSIGREKTTDRNKDGSSSRSTSPTPSSPKSAASGSRASSASVGNYKGNNGGGGYRRSGSAQPYQSRESRAGSSSAPRQLSCLICKGPHKWWECKHKAEIDKLQQRCAALAVQDDSGKEDEPEAEMEEEEPVRCGAIRMMYAMGMNAPKGKECAANMMFVDLTVNGRKTRALIDTGASHNFVNESEAKRLGLAAKEEVGYMKSVNSEAKLIRGSVKQVPSKVGDWEGRLNFTVAQIDDFNLVLGMDFLRTSKAVIAPHMNSLLLTGGQTCLVRCTNTPTEGRSKQTFLSAMQMMGPKRNATSNRETDKGARRNAKDSSLATTSRPRRRLHQIQTPTPKQPAETRLPITPSPSSAPDTTTFKIGDFSFLCCNSCKSTRTSTT